MRFHSNPLNKSIRSLRETEGLQKDGPAYIRKQSTTASKNAIAVVDSNAEA